MRRIFTLFMLCVMLGGNLSLPTAHAEEIQDNDFTYVVQSDDTVMITGYTGNSREVVIPSEIEGKAVTVIGSSALSNAGLASVTIPIGITRIESFAFYRNQLTDLTIPDGVTYIGNNAFESNQLSHAAIPPSVAEIYDYAFKDNRLTAIEIPRVTYLGKGAFQKNLLQSVMLENLTFLGAYAFENNQLESLMLPGSLNSIGMGAFQHNRLASVALPEGLTRIEDYAFANNQLTTLQIPKSVIAIHVNAFESNQLGSVAIPPNVDLGSGDMYPVFGLNPNVAVYVPLAGDVSVQNHASKYGLQIVPCKYGITYDGNGSTGGTPPSSTPYVCYKPFAVPDQGSLTKDGYTFKGWNTMPDGSGTNYFGGNYPIIYGFPYGNLTLYANWETSTYQVTFDTRGGSSVASQTVAYGEQATEPPVPTRAEYAFDGWYQDIGYSQPWDFAQGNVFGDMTLYAKWKWNGSAAISSLELTADNENVTGGDNLTVTGVVRDENNSPVAHAVVNLNSTRGKWKLTEGSDASATTDASGRFTAEWTAPWVTEPESVTLTGSVDGTIDVMDSRTLQVVPSEKSNARLSGLSLGSMTLSPEFSGDTYNYTVADVSHVVTSIEVTATTASDLSKLNINHMPVASGSAVRVPLQTGLNLIPIVVTAGDGLHTQTYTLHVRRASTTTSGDYAYRLKDDGSGIGITRYKGTDSNVVIPETIDGYVVMEIGEGAFANEELTAVTLPNGLTSVNSRAFQNNRLTSITIPSSVTQVGDYAFYNNLLENVMFAEEGLQEIGFGAFSDNQLSSIILPVTTTYLDTNAFNNNRLTQVILPATLRLGDEVFGGTQNGVKLIFPAVGDQDMVNYATSNGFPFESSDVRVEYDGNGQTEGEAPVDNTHYSYYSSIIIQPGGSLKRTGFTFQGWNTGNDGSGNFHEAGKSYKFKLVRGIVKLYAVWEPAPVQYSVSYETNGGTAIPATTASEGAYLAEPPMPARDGYRFAGWYKDPSYAVPWNFEQDKVAGDMTLYAKWESKQLTIRLFAFSNVVSSGEEIRVSGTVVDEDDTPQANLSVHLSSPNGGKWILTETDTATVKTDENGTFEIIWKAPHVFETAMVELSASLDGSSAEPATVSIRVKPLPGTNPSSNADLAGLTLSAGDLTPQFQAAVTSYTADVEHATSSVTIVPEVSYLAAIITFNGEIVESGHPVQVDLNVGPNPVTLLVIAEDATPKAYRVTITRASAPVVPIPVASITVTSVTSSVYEGGTLQMTVRVNPDDATNKQVSWSIQGGTGKAVIDENGLLKAEQAGTVTVQAAAQDGSGVVGSQEVTIYKRQSGGGDTPTTPTNPTTPTSPTTPTGPTTPTAPATPTRPTTPTDPTTQPPEKPAVLHVVPGRPPIDVNDAEAIQTMLEALTAKFNDPRYANVPVFPDMEDHWAADNIRLFARLGIVQGYGDGTFKPDANVTRGEFASMLVRLFPFAQGTAATPDFTDLGDSWARDAVLTLASNGILNGYEDGMFHADRNITRAEMIAILARIVNMAEVKPGKTVILQDIEHTWAKDQIRLAANAGIINGRGENGFGPNRSATRAEVLTVLLRAISISPEIEQLLEGMN
ncbi:leucine-rich repeat protein [uncultured Paenibacillus sp.]|uniref:leucine-rich repeat protein n=1 Tax=uncultured Paenibacillus sp. TaxID=227322 RepID=UPI0015AF72D9|nr:leucine-rich repeat protein [uncultured Paenibacillus sp.]